MPIITRDAPTSGTNVIWPTDQAVDGDYDRPWRASIPAELVVDVSQVPDLGPVVLAWYSDAFNGEYDFAVQGQTPYNLARDYSIALSADGEQWDTVVEIAENSLHSRVHLLDLSEHGMIRLSVTAVHGTPGNDDVALSLDIHDARLGTDDAFLFLGDSITAAGMSHSGATLPQLVHSRAPEHFPLQVNAGMSGWTSVDALEHIDAWLEEFPGRFVVLAFGTNDAWAARDPDQFANDIAALVERVMSRGKIAILPTIPYSTFEPVGNNIRALNDQLRALSADRDDVLLGPDLETFFRSHAELIAEDGVHLTIEGNVALRIAWADWIVANLYGR
jgi:lysophospholipase L1-like esterase